MYLLIFKIITHRIIYNKAYYVAILMAMLRQEQGELRRPLEFRRGSKIFLRCNCL